MKLRYIYHSGFFLEFDECNLVIDYYKGEVGEYDKSKKMYVMCSHIHRDHFNREIFNIFKDCKDITFILSDDISSSLVDRLIDESGIDCSVVYVSPNQSYQIGNLDIETLKSTDEGVGFIITVDGKTVYHSGDLNWWTWEGYETVAEYEEMTKKYKDEIKKISNRKFDLILAVLDPRQKRYDWGLRYLLENVDTRYLCPMHLWDKYEYVEKFIEEHPSLVKGKIVLNPDDIRDGIEWR